MTERFHKCLGKLIDLDAISAIDDITVTEDYDSDSGDDLLTEFSVHLKLHHNPLLFEVYSNDGRPSEEAKQAHQTLIEAWKSFKSGIVGR